MSQLNTNFSGTPYYDDWNKDKNFYKILFVPKRAVQVRELNQAQTLTQEQIRRFGDHVFKDGSVVDGCNITHIPRLSYVRVENNWNQTNQNVSFDSSIQEFLVVSPITDVRATIRLTKVGYESTYPNTNIFYIDYIKSGRDISDNLVEVFQSGEELNVYIKDQDKFATVLSGGNLYNTINVITEDLGNNISHIGETVAVTVGEGIVFQKGYFVSVDTHTITINDYSTDTTDMLVGFETLETLTSHLQDSTLIDPADTSNRNAIGADRLTLTPILISKSKADLGNQDNFYPIIEYGAEEPVIQKNTPDYATLGDVFEKRTYEESGDYYVKPFIVGSSADTSDSAIFNYDIGSGIGYVKGNRVELISTYRVSAPRATTTDEENASILTLNYGNYVIVDEMVGVFDYDQLYSIDIYDNALNSISDLEGNNPAPTGTLVGSANIRAMVYDNGVKGTSNCQYRLYIDNIKMLSGYSFKNDAKSFYSTGSSFGNAKADIVLENSNALVRDSGRSELVFDIGLGGVKRLRSSSGVNDTRFTFRDKASATLQANGFTTFTLNPPHAGGTERFFSSTGVLSNANELKIDIVTSSALFTPSLAGTVDATTVGTTLFGSGTSFLTDFDVGASIRVSQDGSTHYYRQILSIASNTEMNLNASISDSNNASSYSKYFPSGSIMDLGDGEVTVLSNTQFTVALGETFAGGAPQTITASYPVFRSQAVEIKKNVKKGVYVKINPGVVDDSWGLGLVDVFQIEGIYVGSTYSISNPERSSWFALDMGQEDSFYDHSKLVIKPQFKSKMSVNTRILVKLSHFEASDASGIGFFSVDSYPVRNPGDSANTTNISYADIPSYNGKSLRNSVDFRPQKINTANSSTTIAGATINPALANTSFNIASSGAYMGEPDSNFQADVEYYLPRRDIVQVNKDGYFNIKSSIPSLNPKTPALDGDSMSLATTYVPPYPSLTSDEKYNHLNKSSIQATVTGNRGYTMKDIYNIDKRITRLEYYETLSMLESQARDYTAKDENGLDRFKNGIFADPFNNHLLGDVSNFEYSIAIDERESVARPKIKRNNIDLKVGATTGTSVTNRIVSLDYTSENFIEQSYASKYRNVTESVWNWGGELSLFPEYDHSKDEDRLPAVNVNIDLASPWEDFAASPFGMSFGDWEVTNTDVNVADAVVNRGNTTTTTTTTTTTQDLQRVNNRLGITSSMNTNDLGSFVSDITLNPYMRSREVAFIATGLKPNSNFYVFFDGVAVSDNCAMGSLTSAYNADTGTINITGGNESSVVNRTTDWGDQLVTDQFGNLYGLFKIPDGKFRVGDRELLITNISDLTTGEDASISSCRKIYTASSMTVQSRNVSINTIDPQLTTTSETQTSVEVSTNIATRNTTIIRTGGGDPIAQSYLIKTPNGVPGMFMDSIEVYFKQKDENLGITCYITEMKAGVPDSDRIIAKSYLGANQVSVSDDSSSVTLFKFNDIPYLSANKYYAFFLKPDGDSPEYLIWMSEIGGIDILSGNKIFSNPYIGTAFKSANSTSWDVLQTEDIKFRVNRCNFTNTSGSIEFNDQDDEYLTVDGFTIEDNTKPIEVGDVVYTQNSTGGLEFATTAIVQGTDLATDKLVLDSSTGGFTTGQTIEIHRPPEMGNTVVISGTTLIATSVIESVDDIDYSIMVPRIGLVTPFGTDIQFQYKGMTSSEVSDVTWMDAQAESELEMIDKMRVIKSKSNRTLSDYSSSIKLDLLTRSNYTSPIIDMRRRSMMVIENLINDSITDEHTRYGEALSKYVSRKITLAEGQDAEDIKILITAHRPFGTDVTCYMKLQNGEDAEPFKSKLWTKMDMIEGASTFSSIFDENDYREYGFSFPSTEGVQGQAYANPLNDTIVEYRDSDGSIFIGYKSFAIKLVLTSTRGERVAKLRDVRSIALQV